MRRIAEAKTWAHECRRRSKSLIVCRSSKVLRCSDILARPGSYTPCLGKLAWILNSEILRSSSGRPIRRLRRQSGRSGKIEVESESKIPFRLYQWLHHDL